MTGQAGWVTRFVTVTNGGSQPLGECLECGMLTWDYEAQARHREKCPRMLRDVSLASRGPGLDPPLAEILARAATTRDRLGQRVRREWEAWAREQPDVADHPAWTVPWRDLDERDREADRRIGQALFLAGWAARGDGETAP